MTREDVIRQIVAREHCQERLDEPAVSSTARELYATALEHFGTWETALRYAGVRHRKPPAVGYSEAQVLQELRTLCKDGYDLSGQRNRVRNRELYNAARRHFGGWRKALRASGINLDRVGAFSTRGRPSNMRIFEALRERHASGASMGWKTTCLDDRALALAAKKRFGSWTRALAAAGLIPQDNVVAGGITWDKASVIEAIRRRHQEGKGITYNATQPEEPALVGAARRLFGNWGEALKEAGIRDIGQTEIKGR